MFRKNHFTFLLAFALFLVSGIAVFAQTAPVRGKVELKKADGTTTPVADAVIDVFRTDINGKFPSGKTNKKGEFSFAGLPLGAKFAIAVSAPNVRADIFPNIKAGDENITLSVTEGDGKRFTDEEARQALAAPAPTASQTGTQLTAEQKKAQEEYQKQVAEYEAKKNKVENSNKIIAAALQEGSKAFEAKNYDLAVAKFDEGVNADPDFAGTAPILLNNKSSALISRATNNYNQAVKADAAAKTAAMAGVKKDFEDAIAASNRALEVLKTATAADASVQKNYDSSKFQAITNRKEAYRLMMKTGADQTKDKEAAIAFQEYIALETNPTAKTKAQIEYGDAMRDAGNSEESIKAYRAALLSSPDNPDILAGLGLSLFNAGVISNDTAQKQEGLNFMQKFAEVAPENHPLKASVRDAVDYLKTQDKLTPQKVTKKKQ